MVRFVCIFPHKSMGRQQLIKLRNRIKVQMKLSQKGNSYAHVFPFRISIQYELQISKSNKVKIKYIVPNYRVLQYRIAPTLDASLHE